MAALILDIETVGESWDELDETTQRVLTRWIEENAEDDDDRERQVEQVKNRLGFSPFTGQIVAIGVLDHERQQGAVYYQAPSSDQVETEADGIRFRPRTEAELLSDFWAAAGRYDTIVTFNGRGFDAPFLAIRSAVNGLRPSVDLLSNRYLGLQRGVKHVDLMDQLSFYGATRGRPNLHLACRAFGIKSPKADGVDGNAVAQLFADGKYLDIARYNMGDIRATSRLYAAWLNYLRF